MTTPIPDEQIERFQSSFFTMFRSLGPELGLPEDVALTGPQVMMLYSIKEITPCSAGKLAQRMEVTPSAITVMIDRLVQNGFVQRKHDEQDRRVVLLEITPHGIEALQKIKRRRDEKMRSILTSIEPEELERFLVTFEKIAGKVKE